MNRHKKECCRTIVQQHSFTFYFQFAKLLCGSVQSGLESLHSSLESSLEVSVGGVGSSHNLGLLSLGSSYASSRVDSLSTLGENILNFHGVSLSLALSLQSVVDRINLLSGSHFGSLLTCYKHCSSSEHKCNLFHFFAFLNL